MAAGLQVICIKKLSKVDSGNTIVTIGSIGVMLLTALCVFVHWLISFHNTSLIDVSLVWPDRKDFCLLIVMGLLGTVSQLSEVQALKYASISFLSPFQYSKLVLAVPLGLFLGEAFP